MDPAVNNTLPNMPLPGAAARGEIRVDDFPLISGDVCTKDSPSLTYSVV